MRKLILALVTQLLAITVFGDPFAALYAPADFTLYHPGSQQIDITPLTAYTVYDTNIVTHQTRHFSTGTRITATGNVINGVPGSLIVSNMIPGDYKVDIFALGIPQPVASFTNSFTNGTPAYVNAKDFIAVSTNSVNGSGYAYTIAQMNAILANLPGGGGGGSGDVSGPSASTVGELPYFDLTTGKHLGRSGVQYTNIAFQTSLNAVSNSFTTLSNNFVGTSNTVSAATNNLTTVSNSVNAVSTFAIGVSNKWYSGSNDLRTAINNIGNANIPATWSLLTNSSGTLLISNTTGVVAFAVPTNGLPVTTNYAALSTNFTWSQGQIAVFSGSTNSEGSPVFVPTNMPTAGSASALVQSNLYVRDTNGLILDFAKAQTFNVGSLTNGNLWISNANTITNLVCHDVQINLHQWTNGSAKVLTLKNAFGSLTTNGAWTQTTNANATDILVARVDATGTNVVVTPQTNASSYSDTNSLLTSGGGGGGGSTFTLVDNQVAVASGVTEATVTLNTTGAKLVVVGVCNYDGAGGGTDEDPIHSGDTYTGLTKIGAPTGGHYTNQLFYCVSPAQSASYTIKVKHSYIVVCAASFSYSGTTPALDTQAAGNGSSSFTTIQPGSASPTSTGLFVTSLTWSAGSSSATADSSFTLLNRTQEGTDPLYGGMWYKSSSSAENPTLTAPATSFGATTMAVFK